MKKLNRKGFTLIELLAVITIMGILLLVAIPAVSRTIENTRRDTFVDTAKSYINALKTSVAADEVCYYTSPTVCEPISSGAEGYYYYPFTTVSDNESTTKLMEQGGKSSWGGADVHGYIAVHKTIATGKEDDNTQTNQTSGGDTNNAEEETSNKPANRTKYEYAILIIDKNGHGTETLTLERSIKRSTISTRVPEETSPSWGTGEAIAPANMSYDAFGKGGDQLDSTAENNPCLLLDIEG